MASKIVPEKRQNNEDKKNIEININSPITISDEQFNKSVEEVKQKLFVSDEDKLFLYANYKQAYFGDNTTPKPSIFDRIAMAKWKSWFGVRGKTKDEAMNDYVKKVATLR